MDTLVQDLRYALRRLFNTRGFTAVAVLTLALGIGANTAIFSVVHAVLLRPLPYPEPGRLVRLWETTPDGVQTNVVSSGNYLDWRERATVFEEIGATQQPYGMTLTGVGDPTRVQVADIARSALRVLGVPAAVGRTFTAAEAQPGGPEVVLISHALWRQRYGGKPGVVGRTLTLNDNPHTIVGVMPPEFDFPGPTAQVWYPLRFDAADREERRSHNYGVVARLRPGVTVERAESEMNVLAAAIAEEHPANMIGWGVNVVPFRDDIAANVRPLLLVLFGMVGVVLLIACANLANLLLARAMAREREIAVRGALGAGRGRLVRQLLTESGLLALVGGGLGLLVIVLGLDALVALAPADIPLLDDVRVDPVMLAFAACITLLATMLFGLLPALRLTRTGPRSSLRSRPSGGGPLHARLRTVLLVTQVALALVLLVGAGLLVRSFQRLHDVAYGFEPDGVLIVGLDLPAARYETQRDQIAFYDRLVERVRMLPGVAAASATSDPPAGGFNMTFSFAIEGRPAGTASGREDDEPLRAVTPGYFRTMGIPLIRGRTIEETDRRGAPPVVVINETLARKHWPNSNPIGERISFEGPGQGPWFEIVGVVGDTRHYGLDEPVRPALYIAHAQKPWPWLTWLTLTVRAAGGGDPSALAPAVRSAISALDDALPPQRVTTVNELYAASAARRRFAMSLTSAFAAIALALGTLGIYGVLSYAVAQRRREIGLRMALGADSGSVRRLVLRQGLATTAIGIAAGLATAFAATRLMSSLLYGVSATDPATFAGVALLLTAVAVLASYIPARGATKVDPMTALRTE